MQKLTARGQQMRAQESFHTTTNISEKTRSILFLGRRVLVDNLLERVGPMAISINDNYIISN